MSAPQRTAPEEGKGPEGGTRGALPGGVPDDCSSPEPELFDLFEEPGGVGPNLLLEPQGPQGRVPQHTVEQIVDFVPKVQILDAPVLQMADQLADVHKFFDVMWPDGEQVIEVLKISVDTIPQRVALRDPQLPEQLVEVPTVVSHSSLQ